MAQERYIAVYPPALKLPAGGNPATHALEQGMAAWSQQLQQWLSQEVPKILGQATEVTEYVTTDELSQLHESGVVKADLVKLHDITVEAARINTIGKIKARAYRNAAQSIAGTTNEKILIDTIDFDTENVVDVTTNNRIIPNLAGYYQVSGNARLGDIPDSETFYCSIFKNGERVSGGAYFRSGSMGQGVSTVSDLVYMNGTTDYLELYIYNSYSSALPLVVGQSFQNYISIVGPF
ncbi:MAG TPA: hypothetical protein PKN85_02980 [Syntrophorhabdaceae bacterium]|nr:hypothetical protein [Syntrophorhabdaceae bacterium]